MKCKKGKSRNLKIQKFSYGANKTLITLKMQKAGMLKEGILEAADDGVYEMFSGGNRLNRKKMVCFIDTGVNYHVRLPQDCADYCRECDKDHGRFLTPAA